MSKSVWYNGNILTLSAGSERAEALVEEKGRISFVGSSVDARSLAGDDAVQVDLGGRTVVPGFNDNHVHTIILGDHENHPQLAGLSAQEIVELLKSHYEVPKKGEVIVGSQWDYPTCPQPTKELLDAAFPHNPVVLSQYGGHGTWVNSAALKEMGIEKGKPDPPGHGVVLRRDDGEPTGVLREMSGHKFLSRRFFKMFHDRKMHDERIMRAMEIFKRYGITSVQDNTWFHQVALSLTKLRNRGELTTRFSCWSDGRRPRKMPLMSLPRYDSQWVRRGPIKFFLDGSFTTRTAWLWEEYVDEPGNYGQGLSADKIYPILKHLAAKGRQGAFHSIGDRATSAFLDAMERLQQEMPQSRDLRFRLEHAQLVRQEDVTRLRDLGVLVAAQPSALVAPEKDIALLGEKRARGAYPHRSFLDAGVNLSFGSDIPGEATCNPIESIHMVVNRASPERLTVEEALRCFTVGSAYAEFQEEQKGSLTVGKVADFAVLSQDITSIAPAEIIDTKVETTVVGGRVVYEAQRVSGVNRRDESWSSRRSAAGVESAP